MLNRFIVEKSLFEELSRSVKNNKTGNDGFYIEYLNPLKSH